MPPPLTHPPARAAASPQAASSPLSNRTDDCSPPGGRAWVGGLPRYPAKPQWDGFTYFIKRTNTDPKSQPCEGPGAQLVQLPTSQTGGLQSVATTAPRPHCCGSSEGCPPAPGKYKFTFTHCPPLTFQASSPHSPSLLCPGSRNTRHHPRPRQGHRRCPDSWESTPVLGRRPALSQEAPSLLLRLNTRLSCSSAGNWHFLWVPSRAL